MDPIRPFVNLIRSLRANRGEAKPGRTLESAASDSTGEVTESATAAPPQPLEQALQARLPHAGRWDSRRAREIFVEHALSRELGIGFASDPSFADLVVNISELIEQQPHISARLDTLLKTLAQSDTRR